VRAVVGRPAGLCRDHAGTADAVALELAGTDFQGVHGPPHRRIRELPGLAQTLAEPDDARERIDHTEAAPRRSRQEQTAIVGAEIECTIDAAKVVRARVGRMVPWPLMVMRITVMGLIVL